MATHKRTDMSVSNLLQPDLTKRQTVMLIICAVVAGIVADHLLPGWGRSVLTTGAVFAAAIVMWPQFRRRLWFWIPLSLMFISQVLLLCRFGHLRAMVEEVDPSVWFILGFLDFLAVAIVLMLIASKALRKVRQE